MTRAYDTAATQRNSGGAVAGVTAGKNAIINGGFDIWQRGTSFGAGQYTADRWYQSGGTGTSAQETTVVPSGFRYAMKFTASGTTSPNFLSALETNDSLRFAGQVVALSAYFASSTTRAVSLALQYSTTVDNAMLNAFTTITPTSGGTGTATSTYSRVSGVWSVPSDAKSIRVIANTGANMSTSEVFYVTGVQLELGNVATPFARTGGTIQGELAACQRYYYRTTSDNDRPTGHAAIGQSTSGGQGYGVPKVTMRVGPTSVDYASLKVDEPGVASYAITSLTLGNTQPNAQQFAWSTAGTQIGQGRNYILQTSATNGYIGFNAEL